MTDQPRPETTHESAVSIPIGDVHLDGDLSMPRGAKGIVVFAHGSGSSRKSPRNRYVAGVLNDAGVGTLLMDLLTAEEEQIDMRTRHLRFDIGLLAERLVGAIDWLRSEGGGEHLHIGCFGASTGAAAALVAAAERADVIEAVVSRGGRPDLADDALRRVQAPTLLIVGGRDEPVIEMNQEAMEQMPGQVRLEIVSGATHLFEEPGTLDEVARLASEWFARYLASDGGQLQSWRSPEESDIQEQS